MSIGRVFRSTDRGWEPIGDQLPTWEHAPPRPNDPMAVWVLPAGEGYEQGDVIAFAETGHQLIAAVPRTDVAWGEVIHAASLLHEQDEVRRWAANIELWLCRRLPGDWRT